MLQAGNKQQSKSVASPFFLFQGLHRSFSGRNPRAFPRHTAGSSGPRAKPEGSINLIDTILSSGPMDEFISTSGRPSSSFRLAPPVRQVGQRCFIHQGVLTTRAKRENMEDETQTISSFYPVAKTLTNTRKQSKCSQQ